MSGKVIILGANGRFGRVAAEAFSQAGWQVTAFVRPGRATSLTSKYSVIEGDAIDAKALSAAAMGHDVIINALNPPYPKWKKELPRLTAAVIEAARASRAAVMIPGNVYNYGAGMPEILSEETPHKPTTRKGRLRVEMEESYANAADEGVRTIILRAGDFMEREQTGNWFDTYITPKAANGKLVYPGPLDRVLPWAFLPDMARAMVGLAETRANFAMFETFGFEGYPMTGAELVLKIEEAMDRPMKVGTMPWRLIRLMSVLSPQMREVAEMSYLWKVSHRIDGTKLRAALPDFKPTPVEHAIRDALGIEEDAVTETVSLAGHVLAS